MNTNPHAGSRFLDGAVVVFALANLTLFGAALTFRTIPDGNLPILASLGTGLLAVVTAYAVWRFKTPAVPTPDPGTVTTTLTPRTMAADGAVIPPASPQQVMVTHTFGTPDEAG